MNTHKFIYKQLTGTWLFKYLCQIATIVIVFTSVFFTACTDDNVSDLQLSGDCSIISVKLDQYTGKVNSDSRTVEVRVPETYNTQAMQLTELSISDGAVSNITQGQTLNMNAAQNIHVTNGDLYLDWTLYVLRDEAKITSFVINDIYTGIINQDSKTITVYVPKSAGLTGLIPTIEYSTNASCKPMTGVPADFTNPVVYTIENGSAKSDYTVNVISIDKPQVLFIGSAANMNDLDQEARTACNWMLANIPNSLYASFADIQSESIDLSQCKVIWWHYHKDGGVDGHDAFVANAPQALAAKNQLRSFYERGGSFFLTRYATNLPSFIGVTGDDEWTTPNNCWGQNEDAAELCGGPWTFNIYSGQNSHPLYAGLIAGDNVNAVYCTDAGYHITNSTAQYHIGTDWGGYDNYDAWQNRTGGKVLGVGGDGAVVAWEYPATSGKGAVICIGSGCFDWYSYTYEAGYTEKFHQNISIMTKNAFNYLMNK